MVPKKVIKLLRCDMSDTAKLKIIFLVAFLMKKPGSNRLGFFYV